jgi:hypothetical protein
MAGGAVDKVVSGESLSRARRMLVWTVVVLAGVAVALLLGLAAVSVIAATATGPTWTVLADVGESFGLLNAIFSGLALAAVVVTFWMQFTELRSQRDDLAAQREALIKTQEELHRSAEADFRRLHMDLLKMSIDDPQLAIVWPQVTESRVRHKQYQYANLILQHNWLRQHGEVSDAEMRSTLRYLFSSPIIREFWAATAPVRASVAVTGTLEHRMNQLGEEVYAEMSGCRGRTASTHTTARRSASRHS